MMHFATCFNGKKNAELRRDNSFVSETLSSEQLIVDEKDFQDVKVNSRETLKFNVGLESLCGIITKKSIIKRRKGEKQLPVFAIVSYPSRDPLKGNQTIWSNIPSSPLKREKNSSIGNNRETFNATFVLKEAENYAFHFQVPMRKKKVGLHIKYKPEEICLRLGLMRGTEVLAVGVATLLLDGTETGDIVSVPVTRRNSKAKKKNKQRKGSKKNINAGSFRGDPNKKYSLQRSFLRVSISAEGAEENILAVKFSSDNNAVEMSLFPNFFNRNSMLPSSYSEGEGNEIPEPKDEILTSVMKRSNSNLQMYPVKENVTRESTMSTTDYSYSSQSRSTRYGVIHNNRLLSMTFGDDSVGLSFNSSIDSFSTERTSLPIASYSDSSSSHTGFDNAYKDFNHEYSTESYSSGFSNESSSYGFNLWLNGDDSDSETDGSISLLTERSNIGYFWANDYKIHSSSSESCSYGTEERSC